MEEVIVVTTSEHLKFVMPMWLPFWFRAPFMAFGVVFRWGVFVAWFLFEWWSEDLVQFMIISLLGHHSLELLDLQTVILINWVNFYLSIFSVSTKWHFLFHLYWSFLWRDWLYYFAFWWLKVMVSILYFLLAWAMMSMMYLHFWFGKGWH